MGYQIESVGDVPEYNETNTKVSSREDIEAWLAAHQHGPVRQYNALAADDVPSFSMGEGWCGGFYVYTQSGAFWHLEESTEEGSVESWVYGDKTTISRRRTLSVERLTELLTHYLRSEKRPPGRWVDDRGQIETPEKPKPFQGSAPRARGRFSQALVQFLESGDRRSPPDQNVLSLIGLVRDDDLAAYLYAVAHSSALHSVKLHDFWPRTPVFSHGNVQLGTLAGGEPVFYDNGHVVMVDEEGQREVYSGLERFIDEWVSRARENGETTCLDALLSNR